MLRDGIEDYEYMAILERLLIVNEDTLDDAQMQRYATLLYVPGDITSDMTTFTKDPATIEEHRDLVARAIVTLSKL